MRDNTILTNTGNKYMITNKLGSGNAINSSGMMTQSIVSELTISNLNQSDNGPYVCTVSDTEIQQTINVTISKLKHFKMFLISQLYLDVSLSSFNSNCYIDNNNDYFLHFYKT